MITTLLLSFVLSKQARSDVFPGRTGRRPLRAAAWIEPSHITEHRRLPFRLGTDTRVRSWMLVKRNAFLTACSM